MWAPLAIGAFGLFIFSEFYSFASVFLPCHILSYSTYIHTNCAKISDMKVISKKALIFVLCCVLSLNMLSGMKKRGGKGTSRQTESTVPAAQTTTRREKNVVEAKKAVEEKKPLLLHCYDVLEEQVNSSDIIHKDENTFIRKVENNIFWVDVRGDTLSYYGLTLPVSGQYFELKDVVSLKDGENVRAVFYVDYKRDGYVTCAGDISFVAQDLPDLFNRQVIHIPHRILCMAKVSEDSVLVAIVNTEVNDKWTYCFSHYRYSESEGLVNVGKYFPTGKAKHYTADNISITLNPAATAFLDGLSLGQIEERTQIICTHNGK